MSSFEWNKLKNKVNKRKHGLTFEDAQNAFLDKKRIILKDKMYSEKEERFFCIAEVNGKIMTVRFTYRGKIIRIFGAAFWRKGKKIYLLKSSNKG